MPDNLESNHHLKIMNSIAFLTLAGNYKKHSAIFFKKGLICGYGHKEEFLRGNIPGGDVSRGEVICDYMRPLPPRGTGYHRIAFLLYKQEGLVDYTKYHKHLPCRVVRCLLMDKSTQITNVMKLVKYLLTTLKKSLPLVLLLVRSIVTSGILKKL
ncbi:39S ribosomal protein L38, mitochondrial [Halocaridina rubra]|uniref:39S ribosomal protein L38, mitochondrial n=1 Tax=Halocaridina rubra TaxID=373956 RepID=A0AAN8XQE6_HALRR